jgi:hypothetical protein
MYSSMEDKTLGDVKVLEPRASKITAIPDTSPFGKSRAAFLWRREPRSTFFESNDAMKNFQRMKGLIKQIVAVLPPPPTIEAPEAPLCPSTNEKKGESDEEGGI